MLLLAYPSEFRREYGYQMVQVFRDRYRDEARRNSPWSIAVYWFRTLSDLVVTATRERFQNFGKDRQMLNNLRRDIIALVGTIAIIVAALALLSYGRSHEVSYFFVVGRVLDAIVSAGIVGNLIVFLLVKFTKWNSLRIALWTFLLVHAVLVIIIAILGPRIEPHFRLGPIILVYVLSFLFWFGLHWAWRATRSELARS
jgi:hypothetical protein